MKKPKQGLKTIRFLIRESWFKRKKFREILKLRLATTKKDFYLSGRNKYLKISFHDKGKKVLYVKHEGREKKVDLFKDKTYNQDGLNPIFVYFPTKIDRYPITTEYPKDRSMDIILKKMNKKSDFMIKFFWANPNFWINKSDGKIFPESKYKHYKKIKMKGTKLSGEIVKNSPAQMLFNFGMQTLYFDVQNLNREGANQKYEHIIIYEPGSSVDMAEHLKKTTFPINFQEIKKQGCCVARNRDDHSYFITF